MLRKKKKYFIYTLIIAIAANFIISQLYADNLKKQQEMFQEFKKTVLEIVPESRKSEVIEELDKMGKDKKILSSITPERLAEIKADIETDLKANKRQPAKEKTELSKGSSKTGRSEEVDEADKKNISFDFPNVSMEEFARFVASLNEKILIGSNLLQGNVTVKTPEKLSLNELMEVYEALLNSNGLSYMISGDYMQIYQRSNSEVRVYKIDYLKSADVAKSLSDIFKMSFRVGGVPERVMINSLDQANSVVVLAPKEKHAEIAQAIKEIDFRRRQVLMEVRIIEITHTNDFGFGGTAAWNRGNFTTGMAKNATSYDGSPESVIAPTLTNIASPYSGVAYNNGQFMYNLQADETVTELKILSQPKILTSENQKAQIKVGQQQPVVDAQTNMGVSSNSAPIEQTTVDWKDIGIDLNITPRINSKRDVTLDLDMTITSILRTIQVGSWDNYPVIAQRITKNSSTVKDNEILFIGGLLQDEKTTTRQQMPFFGDVPYLGTLFGTTSEEVQQTELIMMIIPRVIESPEEGILVTERERSTFKNYDKKNSKDMETMMQGKRDKGFDTFNLYEYFNDKDAREEQNLIPQNWTNDGY